VEVVDREGWRKEYPLGKALLHIGSDSRNDIVLAGGRNQGIEPRHAQLIAVPNSPAYRLVNLGQGMIHLTSRQGEALPSRASVDLSDGDEIRIGEYTFHLFSGGHFSNAIGLNLQLAQGRLSVDGETEGIVTVRNMGEVAGVQFKLSLEGLPQEWYTLGPGPILFPGAQKNVILQIRYAHTPTVPAGRRPITIRATASEAYPGEVATATQTLEIAPFFRHQIKVVPLD
jgi:hypothetical protein